jgi:hypothetical protein
MQSKILFYTFLTNKLKIYINKYYSVDSLPTHKSNVDLISKQSKICTLTVSLQDIINTRTWSLLSVELHANEFLSCVIDLCLIIQVFALSNLIEGHLSQIALEMSNEENIENYSPSFLTDT